MYFENQYFIIYIIKCSFYIQNSLERGGKLELQNLEIDVDFNYFFFC